MSNLPVAIAPERADHPEVVALLSALDSYLGSLYEPEANHILSVQELLAPNVHFLAARQGGRVIGCGAVRIQDADAEVSERHGEIKRMFVSPACRGQRVAERLLETLEAELVRRGVALALLETGDAQAAALRLYQRCGYTRRGAFGGYPDNGLSVFMHKRLS